MKNAYPNELKVPSGFSRRDEAVFPTAMLLLFFHIGHIIFFVYSFLLSVLNLYAYPEKALPMSMATTT